MLMARKFVEPGKKKIHFAVSDTDEFRREMTDLGLTYDGATPVVAARDAHENRYVMKSPFRCVLVVLTAAAAAAAAAVFSSVCF
jgi:hypothetical protein